LVLVPHQRPAQRLAPEEADLPGAVAGELPEQAAPGEEGVARLDHAELVALGVGQDDVPLLGALPDIEVAGAEPQRRRHRVLLVGAAGAGQVQVHAVRPHLLRAARDEPEGELGALARQERTTGVLDELAAEHAGPELRQASRVVRIEGHRQGSREHHRTVDTGQRDNKAPSRAGLHCHYWIFRGSSVQRRRCLVWRRSGASPSAERDAGSHYVSSILAPLGYDRGENDAKQDKDGYIRLPTFARTGR